MWKLLGIFVTLSVVSEISAVARVETVRRFDFPDDASAGGAPPPPPDGGYYAPPAPQDTSFFGGSDDLTRQGITNGTVISIPNTVPGAVQTFPVAPLPAIVNNGSTCVCVPTGQCNGGTGIPGTGNFGDNQIDVRIISTGGVTTSNVLNPITGTPAITTASVNPQPTTCGTNLQLCCLAGGYQCGTQYPAVAGSPPVPTSDSAYFGQFPWQAVLLTTGDVYVGSGVLVDNLNVVTVAHRVLNYRNGQFLKVRLGEWDASGTREPIPAQEFTVVRVTIHPSFVQSNLRNDVAVLRLSARVPLGTTPTITTACMTTQAINNIRCIVSGWGRNAFVNGQYQTVQKQTDVPIVDQATCQARLQSTRLGPTFTLDTQSFMCAGGEVGKDACTGDGGAPLVCNLNGRWYAVGLVAWGIGCATQGVPGVYVNLANYIAWIQSQLTN